MGSIQYDFLTESFLFDESLLEDSFKQISEKEVVIELNKYREFCLSNIQTLQKEIIEDTSNLKVFSGIETPDTSLLKLFIQCAFYVEQFILYDPLFDLTRPKSEMAQSMNQYLGLKNREIDKHDLAKRLRFLKKITSMVAANYIKMLPVSYLFEAPSKIPIYFSPNYFSDILPENLLNWFHENAVVRSLKKDEAGLIVENKIYPSRGIYINFKKHNSPRGYIYQLFEQEIFDINDSERTFNARLYLPDTPPEKNRFQSWVFQSINRSAKEFYDRIFLENYMAINFNANYLSSSEFVFELLKQDFQIQDNISTHTVNTLLKFDLPFLEKIDINKLMEIRLQEGEVFQNFRIELDRKFRELRNIKNSDELQIRTENIYHELSEVQIHEINKEIKRIKKNLLIESSITFGGLLSAVQTGGWSLIPSAIALLKGIKSYQDYVQKIKQNPSFFLWKAYK